MATILIISSIIKRLLRRPALWLGPDFIQGPGPPLAPALAFQWAQDEHRSLSLKLPMAYALCSASRSRKLMTKVSHVIISFVTDYVSNYTVIVTLQLFQLLS